MGWKTDDTSAPPLDDLFILEGSNASMISSPLLSPHEKIVFKMLDKISSRTVFGAYIEIDITVTNSGENTLKSMKKLGQEVKHII